MSDIGSQLWAETAVDAKSRKGWVRLHWGKRETVLSPEAAKSLGVKLIQGAIMAKADESLIATLKGHAGMDDAAVQQFMRALRKEMGEQSG